MARERVYGQMKGAIIIIFFFITGASAAAFSQTRAAEEDEIKTAFIYNFAKFTEWANDFTAMNICVTGKNPFGRAIHSIEGKAVRGKSIKIKFVRPQEGFENCQVLFISSSESPGIGGIINEARKSNVLTIGDSEGFLEKGVIINMYLSGGEPGARGGRRAGRAGRVRFDINAKAAEDAGLKISSSLLMLARPSTQLKREMPLLIPPH